jgi:acyl-CoA reductase-like NAD-dependent aldehyde dehydrogenase
MSSSVYLLYAMLPLLQTHCTHALQEKHNGEVVVGGTYVLDKKYLAPTIVLNPSRTSKLMTEEIFGPILSVLVIEGGVDEVCIVHCCSKSYSETDCLACL